MGETAYTCKIVDGEITTGKDFLTWCVNAFMPYGREYGMYMGEPPVEKLYRDDMTYHERAIDAATRNKEKYTSMSDDEFQAMIKQKDEESRKQIEAIEKKDLILIDKYNRIKDEVMSWKCSAEFEPLKEFALKQIEISTPSPEFIKELMTRKDYETEISHRINDVRKEYIEDCEKDIAYHTRELERINNMIKKIHDYHNKFNEEISKLCID